MSHGDALGAAGAAGRVDDVGEVGGVDLGFNFAGNVGVFDIEQNDLVGHGLEPADQSGGRHERRHAGVLGHDGEPLGGLLGVERHVGGTGLEHAEDGGGEFDRLLQQHADATFRADAESSQPSRDPVRGGPELRVGRAPTVADHGDAVRNAADLVLDESVQRRGRSVGRRAAAGLGQFAAPLLRAGEDDL